MTKIHVVIGIDGEYSDRIESAIIAFANERDAQTWIDRAAEQAPRLKGEHRAARDAWYNARARSDELEMKSLEIRLDKLARYLWERYRIDEVDLIDEWER